jgi:transposase
MFARAKRSVQDGRTYEYLQIVETYRDQGKVRQRIVATIGRLDELTESGKLDGLLTSVAKFSKKLSVIGEHRNGGLETLDTRKSGPGAVFGRIWKNLGIDNCIQRLLRERRFKFDVEAAVFMTTLHRLMDPGSDRAAEKWRHDYALPEGAASLDLHQLYRAMAWLGEELPEKQQDGKTPFSPRCIKDLIEEDLFARRRDLFSEVSIVFFDTTTLYFEGEGGEIGKRGNSKDFRPHLNQMVVGLVIDADGRPLCSEMWPGNTTDVKSLLPVVDRLRKKFGVGRICVVSDRGMISKETIDQLEKRKLEYILGARMRSQKEVKNDVLTRGGRFKTVHPSKKHSKDPSPLKVKEVWVEDRRYVVCQNDAQARKDAADRENILIGLEKQLKQGDKSLVGNKGYRKYLKAAGDGFSIDYAKAEKESKFDGKWVLRTNIEDIAPENIALTYKQLWMVESLFRDMKSLLDTRPIYHKCSETIRGHVFCSFLALLLMRELQEKMDDRGWMDAEWNDVIRDLDSLVETQVQTNTGERFIIRGALKGWCGKTFQATGVAIPPAIRPVGEGADT